MQDKIHVARMNELAVVCGETFSKLLHALTNCIPMVITYIFTPSRTLISRSLSLGQNAECETKIIFIEAKKELNSREDLTFMNCTTAYLLLLPTINTFIMNKYHNLKSCNIFVNIIGKKWH